MIRLDGKYWPFESADSTCQTCGNGEKASRLSSIARSRGFGVYFGGSTCPLETFILVS